MPGLKRSKKKKRRKNEEIFNENLLTCVSGMAWGILLKFKKWLPFMVANSTVNLVPFGQNITELWMHKNRDFVVPVNIHTLFERASFSWAAQHTTVCLDHGWMIYVTCPLTPLWYNWYVQFRLIPFYGLPITQANRKQTNSLLDIIIMSWNVKAKFANQPARHALDVTILQAFEICYTVIKLVNHPKG